jgi:hypothetical protein
MIRLLKNIVLGLCCALSMNSWAQKDSLQLKFNFSFDKLPLEAEKWYVSKQNDSLQFSTVKLYAYNIQVYFTDHTNLKAAKQHHLVDWQEAKTCILNIGLGTNKKIKKITFDLGVDSLSSVSGALGGDLDPTRGMYWAWQSGYINFKIEGKCPTLTSRKNQFQYHIGGYLKPNNALRKIEITPNIANPNLISIDLAAFFENFKVTEFSSVMIPGNRAMKLADNALLMFKQ